MDFHLLFVSSLSLFYSLLYTSVPLLSLKFHLLFSLVSNGILSLSHTLSPAWFCTLGNSFIFSQVAGWKCNVPCNLLEVSTLFLSFFLPLVFFLSLSVSYRIFVSLIILQLAEIEEEKSFFQAFFVCLEFQQCPVPNMMCIYRGYLFPSSKSIAVGRKRSSARYS